MCLLAVMTFRPYGFAAEAGYAHIANGHIVRDGKRLRLWGVNFNQQPWWTRIMIERQARRIRRMGFNAVRFWPNRKTFYGVNVKVSPPPRPFRLATYKKGDNSRFDLFDYMFHCVKKEGLLINMTALNYYAPFFPEAYDVLPPESDADRKAWSEGVMELRKQSLHRLSMMSVFDNRMEKILFDHAARVLHHVNPYTGNAYGEEPAVCLWDLSNEWHLPQLMRGNIKKRWPAYFRGKMRTQFNEWLAAKFSTRGGLVTRWGAVADDEDPAKGSVRIGLQEPSGRYYPARRQGDFLAFVVEVETAFYRRFEQHVRRQAPSGRGIAVQPISWGTYQILHLPSLAVEAESPVVNCSTYFSGRVMGHLGSGLGQYKGQGWELKRDKSFHLFPWEPALSRPCWLYIFDTSRIAGKPMVSYETNETPPSEYRAEWPYALAAFASWQDWDGIFYYTWNCPMPPNVDIDDEGFGKMPLLPSPGYLLSDEVMQSAVTAAGKIFLEGYIRPAPNPTVFTIDLDAATDPAYAETMLDRRFTRGAFYDDAVHGNMDAFEVARSQDLSAEKERYNALPKSLRPEFLERAFRHTAFRNGAAWRFVMNASKPIAADGDVAQPAFPEQLKPNEEIEWDWRNCRLFVRTPRSLAAVGFFPERSMKLAPSVTVSGLNRDFVAVSFVSRDGLPLEKSAEILVSAVSSSRNTAMKMVGGACKDRGRAPVIIDRVSGRFSAPWLKGKRLRRIRFALKEYAHETLEENVFDISETEPFFYGILQSPQ